MRPSVSQGFYSEHELKPEATHKEFLLVRTEGNCEVKRKLDHNKRGKKDKVIKTFRRPYTPVPYTPNPKDETVNSKEFKSLYKWEQYPDIYHLLANGDRVWALTSTIDKTKGILVDVFNIHGQLFDQFYLQIPGLERPDDPMLQHLYFKKGFLFTIRMDNEDNPYIVKYKLEE